MSGDLRKGTVQHYARGFYSDLDARTLHLDVTGSGMIMVVNGVGAVKVLVDNTIFFPSNTSDNNTYELLGKGLFLCIPFKSNLKIYSDGSVIAHYSLD